MIVWFLAIPKPSPADRSSRISDPPACRYALFWGRSETNEPFVVFDSALPPLHSPYTPPLDVCVLYVVCIIRVIRVVYVS